MKMTESQKLECKIKREFFMEIVQTFNSNDKAAIINKLDQIREKKENGDKFSITNVVLTKILSNPDLNKNLFSSLFILPERNILMNIQNNIRAAFSLTTELICLMHYSIQF